MEYLRSMDSKVVNKRIRVDIRPLLKELGFTAYTGRNFWRHNEKNIDVISFESFNSYNASVMGCTTFSFAVRLGCYFTDVPITYNGSGPKIRNGVMRPCEAECHFRGSVERNLHQPAWNNRAVWYIDQNCEYLERAISDVKSSLSRIAVSWFERLSDSDEVLRILLSDDVDMLKLWGFGNNPSPLRHYLIGYLAKAQGQFVLARSHLSAVLESGSFGDVSDRIRSDIRSLPK